MLVVKLEISVSLVSPRLICPWLCPTQERPGKSCELGSSLISQEHVLFHSVLLGVPLQPCLAAFACKFCSLHHKLHGLWVPHRYSPASTFLPSCQLIGDTFLCVLWSSNAQGVYLVQLMFGPNEVSCMLVGQRIQSVLSWVLDPEALPVGRQGLLLKIAQRTENSAQLHLDVQGHSREFPTILHSQKYFILEKWTLSMAFLWEFTPHWRCLD